jgi:hydrogenase expression/formation protein HypD
MTLQQQCRQALEHVRHAASLVGDVRFMEVCGTHTVNAFRSGLHSLMPRNVRLLSGPGCPVCVTSQGDIDQILALACESNVTLCTYGDMLRVPGRAGNLERARANGADVQVIYSAMDAVTLAATRPERQIIFAAVGFETTAPATAVAILQAQRLELRNFTILASHKRIVPAMDALLRTQPNIDGFLCPGHVGTIIGADAFAPIVEEHHVSCVISGFEGFEIADAVARLCELRSTKTPALDNLYPAAVTRQGNLVAQRVLDEVFQSANVYWRGLGELPLSGLEIRPRFARFDARRLFDLPTPPNEEPPGCRCGEVIAGRCEPAECVLFRRGCTPLNPIGPCMVSSEGTCQAWFKYRPARAEVVA